MCVRNFFDGTKYERSFASFIAQFKESNTNRIYVRLSKEYLNEFLEAIAK